MCRRYRRRRPAGLISHETGNGVCRRCGGARNRQPRRPDPPDRQGRKPEPRVAAAPHLPELPSPSRPRSSFQQTGGDPERVAVHGHGDDVALGLGGVRLWVVDDVRYGPRPKRARDGPTVRNELDGRKRLGCTYVSGRPRRVAGRHQECHCKGEGHVTHHGSGSRCVEECRRSAGAETERRGTHMLRRYWPPTSKSALVICPSEATRTVSSSASKTLPPVRAVS